MTVPLFDTKTPLAPLREALDAKAAEVLDAGRYILGPEVAAFEAELAAYLGDAARDRRRQRHRRARARAARDGRRPGRRVVVPSFTFYASAEAIAVIGANPVFCDIDPATFCVTPETVRAALTPHTKVVIVVHLFGNIAPVAAIAALGVPVLEDAAQAAGSRTADGRRAGALGAAATFSFFPSKNLGRLRRRRRGRDRRRRARRARADAALPRLARQGHVRARRPQLAPRRAAGRAAAARAAPPRRLVRRPPRRRRALRRGRPRRARRRCPSPSTAASPPGTSTWSATSAPTRSRRRSGARHRLQALLPRAAAPPGGDARRGRDVELPGTDEAARTHLAIPMSPVLTREQAARSSPRCAMRIWVDLTNSPHVLVMRPVIRALEARGAGSTSPRATSRRRSGCASGSGSPTRRSATTAAAGWPPRASASPRARSRSRTGPRARRFDVALGHGSNDVTVAAKLLGIPSATTFDYEWATVQHTRQLPARAARRRARRDPARAARPLRRDAAQAAPLPGAQGGVLPRGLRARRRGARRARARRRRSRSPSSARRPRSRSTTASSTRSSPQLLERLREQAQTVVLPRTPEQRAELARRGRLRRPRARGRRAVAGRLRRPRRLRRRDDEPRGGRARHAGLDDVRGPPRRGRRAADRRGPAAAARRAPRTSRSSSATPPGAPRAPSACAATRPCSPTCWSAACARA